MKQSISEYYAQNPKIFFDPETPGSEESAEIFELLVNQKWSELKMKQIMRDGIKSTKLYGACAFKTYFQFDKDYIPDEWNDRVKNDDVRTDRISLCNLLKDPSSTSWHTSPWVGHQVEAIVSDIAEKFGIKETKDITVTRSADKDAQYIANPDVKSDFQFGTYYEVEDRRNKQVFCIVDGIDKKFNVREKPYSYDSMYDFLFYNDLPDCPDPLADYSFWEHQLIELARFRTMQINHAKKGVAKYKSVGNAPLTEEQRAELKSPADSAVVQLSAGQDVVPFQHAGIDPGIFAAESAVRGDIQIISKQAPRQVQGQDKTATEVKAVEQAALQVSSENRERLEEVMASIANKWATLMQENYTATRVIALTEMTESQFLGYKDSINSPEAELILGSPKKPFLKINSQNLQGKVKARIKAGSTLPDSDEARMNKLLGFVKFASTIPALSAQLDMEELMKEGVNVFDVRNENITIKKDNPVMESQLLSSGTFVPAHMREDHDKHLEIHQREFKGSDQEVLHISMHKQFKSQIAQNQAAELSSRIHQMQGQGSGLSFMGSMMGPQNGPLPPMGAPTQGMVPSFGQMNGGMPPIGVQ